MKNNLAQKILERLDKEGIKQIPGWWFKTKNVLFWLLWVIFVIIGGSFSVAAMTFHTRFAGWTYYPITHGSLGSFIVQTFPYIWLIILIGLLFIGYENFKNTKHGYKYAFPLVVSISLLACFIGGFILYTTGLGRMADENIGRHLPFNHSTIEQQGKFWSKPNEGLLFGDVVSINETDSTFILNDKDKNEWVVNDSELSETDKTTIQPSANIRLIGWREDSKNIFNACFVIPWETAMRPDNPEHNDCQNNSCPPPPALLNGGPKKINSCKDIPGYEFLVKMKETEE